MVGEEEVGTKYRSEQEQEQEQQKQEQHQQKQHSKGLCLQEVTMMMMTMMMTTMMMMMIPFDRLSTLMRLNLHVRTLQLVLGALRHPLGALPFDRSLRVARDFRFQDQVVRERQVARNNHAVIPRNQ